MNKKIIAIITELIPIVSAVTSYTLIVSNIDSVLVRKVISVTMILAFLGFAFFFIGRKIAKEDKAVRVLGVLDLLMPVLVIGFYVIAFMSVGM